jgi:hypothetical protein
MGVGLAIPTTPHRPQRGVLGNPSLLKEDWAYAWSGVDVNSGELLALEA